MSRKTVFLFFIDGFLYTFGLSDNPVKKVKRKISSRSDNYAISKDWHQVGVDIKNAFDESKEACKA